MKFDYSHPIYQMGKKFKNKPASLIPEQPLTDNLKVLKAIPSEAPREQAAAQVQAVPAPSLQFPPHLYTPEGAETLDLRRASQVSAGATQDLIMQFEAPRSGLVRFVSYGVYNDGLNGLNYDFYPRINGNRILNYHGDPLNDFRIYIGLGPDLSEQNMIPCQIIMHPGDKLTWHVRNGSAVITAMGVRMKGYFDTGQSTTAEKFA